MTEKESKLLQGFEQKVNRLTSMYNQLEDKYRKLDEVNRMLQNQIVDLKDQNESLAQDYQNATMAVAFTGSEENSKMTKKKINQLIKEIDQCIAMLSK
ncbi:hypothetical protein K5X82_16750 [Halosquirtibacter xylanolyticus]|uniref:hypothetical protein n=1 Tax=Halosquirtibacter xylanolyticus TaxID=3374599 RepID=UPI003748160A|nr:hypothetical protein K5X82_16750 [Prolixibacteraceae bacterium]